MRKLPRDLVLILRTEAKNQRTPPIDYVIAEDGGRMVHRPEPDIAMAELLEEAATALASERAAHAETKRERDEARKALEPFANIEPSTAVAHDGSEAEPYCVYLACRDRFDFTGADLAAARRAREGGNADG